MEVDSVMTEDVGPVSVRQVATGLVHPWGMAFLPDGKMLVTERAGRLRVVDPKDGSISPPLYGVPRLFVEGQGGLLDVALDPDFEDNRTIYLSYAKPGDGDTATTALGKGKLSDDLTAIEDFEDLFVEMPYVEGAKHFGGRIVFGEGDELFLTLGERFKFEPAQDLGSHLGSLIRITRDGTVPGDNPFVDQDGAMPEIYSYGHRNVIAAARNGEGTMVVVEMGPLGGDELNVIEKGANYGWPIVSWGIDYTGDARPDPSTRPEFEDAAHHWSPVISPSGATFYTGDVFEAWQGKLLVGSLSDHCLVVIEMDGDAYVGETRVPLPNRIRDVEQGPDGRVYLLVDDPKGHVWRVQPLGDE
jgi:glucose/arabinose dehydrogenase